nr:hypothetical protein [Tanacetum cinerariifolium]
MANLEFCDKHNVVAYLEKSEGSAGFHEIIDFLSASHIHYALIENLTIYVSFIKQFWITVAASTRDNGEIELTATVDRQVKTLTEASLRRHLKLEDNGGVSTLPNLEIFEQLSLMVLTAPETSPLRITSSPSLSSKPSSSTSQPENTQPIHDAKEPAPTPYESPLQSVLSLGHDEGSLSLNELMILYTNLSHKTIKTSKDKRKARIIVSKEEDVVEDSSKQGMKISDIDEELNISLVQDKGITWFQEDAVVQEKQSNDTEVLLEEEEPTKLVKDQGSGEKGQPKVTTGDTVLNTAGVSIGTDGVSIGTASATPVVSTAIRIMYSRRSAENRKDKAKEIIKEPEPEKKSKTYHALQNRPRFIADVRKNMCIYLKNQGGYKMKDFKGMSYDDIIPIFKKQEDVVDEQVVKESTKKDRGRKESLARKRGRESLSEESSKKQKLEDDAKKEELQGYLNIMSEDEERKYPLSQDILSKMLSRKLEVNCQSKIGYELIRINQGLGSTFSPYSDYARASLDKGSIIEEFIDQHKMVACVERTDGNTEFHQIVDFLTTSSIHYALTVGDEAVYIREDDKVVRAATTATSLEAEHESGNIHKTRSTTILNESSPQGTSSDVNTSGSREASMEHQYDLTDFIPLTSHDLPLSGGHTPGSDEGDFNDDIDDMVTEVVENVEGDIVNVGGSVNTATTGVSAASVSISTAEPRTPPTTTTIAFKDKDLTISQTLVKMRNKGKGIMVEPQNPPKNLRKAQIQMDEELAMRLHEEEKVELERMQRDRVAQEEASNAALTVEFDEVQARMDADALFAARIQEEEREQFFINEHDRFLVEIIAKRKRFFAAQMAEQIRNKPPTKIQLRNKMITYLKNMGSFTYNQLKNKSLEEIQKLYEREQKWINDFVRMDSETRCGRSIQVSKGKVEKKYPLTQEMLLRMLNRRLKVDHESEMAFELLKFIRSQIEKWKSVWIHLFGDVESSRQKRTSGPGRSQGFLTTERWEREGSQGQD